MCDTVVAVWLDVAGSGGLPEWLPAWCLDHLESHPTDVLFQQQSTSAVFGVRLADNTDVVIKVRPDEDRIRSCVTAQTRLAERGFPCPRPLTPVISVGPSAVHAEALRPGGEVLHGDSPEVAVRYAEVFALLMTGLADLAIPPPMPNPRWVRWDHPEPEVWPSIESLVGKDQRPVPAHVTETARRVRRRMLATDLPRVLGHADFEAHNLRWHDQQVRTVHDWDSLAWQPEAALVGAASAVFPKMGPATLPPIHSTEAFLAAYQAARRRSFTTEEQQIAWAASLWPAAHDVRWEALHGYIAVTGKALWAQASERLRRAHA